VEADRAYLNEAAQVDESFRKAWAQADVTLIASRF